MLERNFLDVESYDHFALFIFSLSMSDFLFWLVETVIFWSTYIETYRVF